MKKKRAGIMFAALLMVCCLGGCKGTDPKQDSLQNIQQETENTVLQENSVTEETEGEKNTALKSDKAILVVSFGTSYNDSREKTIGAIEETIRETFPDYEVRRAFTSQIIIDKLKERDGLEIDNVEQALDRAKEDGVKELFVQPTHLMSGYEYQDLAKELTDSLDQFDKVYLGEPLLSSDEDFDAVIKAITDSCKQYEDGETAICFMGHGTEADSNGVYATLQEKIKEAGYLNYYIGTVEAEPTLEDVMTSMKSNGQYKKVVLRPLMVVAGDHANNDMAGEEEDSWKSVLEREGYEVTSVIEGLGELEAIRDLYAEHVQDMISSQKVFEGIAEDGQQNEMIGEKLHGVYSVKVESSSSMFQIVQADLTVSEDGSMEAVITLSGTGYDKLYMGTGEEAAKKENESGWIVFSEDEKGAYTFTIPVEALDEPITCAAYSKKKETWYDRQITFLSSSLKKEAQKADETTQDTENSMTNQKMEVKDGSYTVEITMEGGSKKATILSPVVLNIENGQKTATIQWSSENYDYMIVENEKYLPISTEGGSVFQIPVKALDETISVIGDTIAMSKPREIEYSITFHSDTMKPAE